jgi:hypothetical protein
LEPTSTIRTLGEDFTGLETAFRTTQDFGHALVSNGRGWVSGVGFRVGIPGSVR